MTGKVPCGHVLELLHSRAAEVDETIRQLRELKAELERLVERATTLDPAECDPEPICTSSVARSRGGGVA